MPSSQLIIAAAANPSVWVNANLIGNAAISRSGGTSASASSGGGGWQVVDRARQKASTQWVDYYPFVMTCLCLLDGGSGLVPGFVEQEIATLESFETPVSGSAPPLPPILAIRGPVPHTDLFWVCSRLSQDGGEDGAIRDVQTGLRTQQGFTIELTEYSPARAIALGISPAQQAALNAGSSAGQGTLNPSGKTYTVQVGDSFQTIAARLLGDATRWTQIALLNGMTNSALLIPGTVLQIPA